MKRHKGFTIIELMVAIAIIAILAGILLPFLATAREAAKKSKCVNNLKQIGQAVAMYMGKYGDGRIFLAPADQFRGDTWLCSLYWQEILSDKRVLTCPSTGDSSENIQEPDKSGWGYPITAAQFSQAGTVATTSVSYCGRTNMAGISATETPMDQFNDKAFRNSPVACDKATNHGGLINVAFSDTHVEPLSDASDYVGDGSKSGTGGDILQLLQYMDSGE